MVCIAQLVRALDCGSRGCQFDSDCTPKNKDEDGRLFLSFLFGVERGNKKHSGVEPSRRA